MIAFPPSGLSRSGADRRTCTARPAAAAASAKAQSSGLAVYRRPEPLDLTDLYHFWSKVFAVAFGMSVAAGLVMTYQFGTNWSESSRFAGGITGPLLAYEVLTAFFLEAGFLGVMLFGMQRVGPGLHFVSTLAVAVGTLISSTCIASNSWMYTAEPAHGSVLCRLLLLERCHSVLRPRPSGA